MDMQLWINALTKPKEVFPAELKKASLMDGAKNFALAGFVGGLLSGLVMSFVGVGGLPAPGLNVVTVLMSAVMMAVLLPIVNIIAHLILYVIAKLLGGTGSWTSHFYLLSLIALPFNVITTILNAIPMAGGILAMLVSLYGLYIVTLAIKISHDLSTMKAVAVWLIPALLLFVLIFLVMGVAVLAALSSGSFPLPKG